ncbi:class I SAM-dependent methyltransferase [Aureivirga sp. CE67]|uniref:class I SAM-dependent methyltransferase n=1 Tax=Aureivirga sp. CE67 TaxID=1788983 RepID=UPI0018CB3961|nr:class I SAM-dependent methyltransferase [Aureivirga sp. CE67]
MEQNTWQNKERANAYDKLSVKSGTYFLAFRDLPSLFEKYVKGNKAIDFGCGAGRSTLYLKMQGFETIGIDISDEMLALAKINDPEGTYYKVENGDYRFLGEKEFDLVMAMHTFDSIAPAELRIQILKGLKELLNENGVVFLVAAAEELWKNDSFSFAMNLEVNKKANAGEPVYAKLKNMPNHEWIKNYNWTKEDYVKQIKESGFEILEIHDTIGKPEDGICWIIEEKIAPFQIYILKAK